MSTAWRGGLQGGVKIHRKAPHQDGGHVEGALCAGKREGEDQCAQNGGRRGLITSVQGSGAGGPLSAELVLGVVLVQQFDVCEWEVAPFAFTFALPLPVHVDFGHLHHVAHL